VARENRYIEIISIPYPYYGPLVSNAETEKYLGCFKDSSERTLPEYLLNGGSWIPEECFQIVKERNL